MPDLLDLEKAKKELDSKDLLTIERETALTWGGRAAASYVNVVEEEDHAEQMRSFWEGETYRAEAVEHAAMTEDARFVERLTVEIEGHRAKARGLLLAAGHAFVAGNRTPKAMRGERPPVAKAMTWERVDDDAPHEPAKQAKPAKGPIVSRPSASTPGLGRRPENENRLA
ncbi:MAG: hypothetical protein QOC71_1470 [Thermoplasmata archaeon]|jgi:hypothetical protein|nr:hypothetical protein [Thermoplasmata archaeon]